MKLWNLLRPILGVVGIGTWRFRGTVRLGPEAALQIALDGRGKGFSLDVCGRLADGPLELRADGGVDALRVAVNQGTIERVLAILPVVRAMRAQAGLEDERPDVLAAGLEEILRAAQGGAPVSHHIKDWKADIEMIPLPDDPAAADA